MSKYTSWHDWNEGDVIRYHWNDFDGQGSLTGSLAAKYEDHAIVKTEDGQTLWIDDSTQNLFRRIS